MKIMQGFKRTQRESAAQFLPPLVTGDDGSACPGKKTFTEL
jgi:hypothetical protein